MCIRLMLCTNKRARAAAVTFLSEDLSQAWAPLTFARWNLSTARMFSAGKYPVGARLRDAKPHSPLCAGESYLRVLPNERGLPSEPVGTPLPDSKSELPPVIRRAELVIFALVTLLLISVFAVLYVAKAFFLPVVTAFVVGTMLAPAAYFLERHRIPRWVAAVLIVSAAGAGVAFIVGLISSPLMEWSTRLPELASLLKDKLQVFHRPLALWQQFQIMLGGSDIASFHMPKLDWIQPASEFLSPTFTEFLLLFVTLI